MTADPSRILEPQPIAGQVQRESVRGRPAEWIRYRERGSQWMLRLMAYLSLRLGRRLTRGESDRKNSPGWVCIRAGPSGLPFFLRGI